MDFTIEKMDGFKVIGFEKTMSEETAYRDCPQFWSEYAEKYMGPLHGKEKPENDIERAICDNNVGEIAVCLSGEDGSFKYVIAGVYKGSPVPEGMVIHEFPDCLWAKFKCVGRMPAAIQALNTEIFTRWMPGNDEYDLALPCNIEWYSMDDMDSEEYESGIWVPVRRKSGEA